MLWLDKGFRTHSKTLFYYHRFTWSAQTHQCWGKDFTFCSPLIFHLLRTLSLLATLVLQFLLDIHISLKVSIFSCFYRFPSPFTIIVFLQMCYWLWSTLKSSVWKSHRQNKLHFFKCFFFKVQYSHRLIFCNIKYEVSNINRVLVRIHLISLKIS